MDMVKYIWAVVAGYLLGAIPVGQIASKVLKGVDVTKVASGRIGASNVLRAAGTVPAAITLVGDAAKGMLATMVGRLLGGTPLAAALAASASVIGHDCSVFVRWRGGVGTITSLGATAMLAGPVAGGLAALGALVVGLSRYSSLGSMVIAIFLPIALLISALATGGPTIYVVHGLIGGGAALLALRPNIKRLLSGTERRIGDKISV